MNTPEEIVTLWFLGYDRRLPSDHTAKELAFKELIQSLMNAGYTRDVFTERFKIKIVNMTVPQHFKPEAKRRIWWEINKKCLDENIICFPVVPTIMST